MILLSDKCAADWNTALKQETTNFSLSNWRFLQGCVSAGLRFIQHCHSRFRQWNTEYSYQNCHWQKLGGIRKNNQKTSKNTMAIENDPDKVQKWCDSTIMEFSNNMYRQRIILRNQMQEEE